MSDPDPDYVLEENPIVSSSDDSGSDSDKEKTDQLTIQPKSRFIFCGKGRSIDLSLSRLHEDGKKCFCFELFGKNGKVISQKKRIIFKEAGAEMVSRIASFIGLFKVDKADPTRRFVFVNMPSYTFIKKLEEHLGISIITYTDPMSDIDSMLGVINKSSGENPHLFVPTMRFASLQLKKKLEQMKPDSLYFIQFTVCENTAFAGTTFINVKDVSGKSYTTEKFNEIIADNCVRHGIVRNREELPSHVSTPAKKKRRS